MTGIKEYIKKIKLPDQYSHKGQNGKLLLIGGSNLFHAASKWSLDIASKFVDMVMYSSLPSNNQLIQEAKQEFWNGIVINREDVESYIEEVDCVLIGPGMERAQPKLLNLSEQELTKKLSQPPSTENWNNNTELVVNYLLRKYPTKKWVIDAGALQMVLPQLLSQTTIITPHTGELERLEGMMKQYSSDATKKPFDELLQQGVAVVLKGQTDFVYHSNAVVEVTGGSAGMTKGGTGDVLAGLVAALYCTNDIETAAVVGSYINKKAGERLAEATGPFFNASDLVDMIPKVLWDEIRA